jgi:signal transduction histidine kinase
MYSRYGSKLSHTTIFAQLAVMAIYPSLCVIVCKLILSFLIAVHRNKQLAESIKHILQVFPECVIIRNRKHEEAVTVFMNNEAANDLYDVDNLKIQIVADRDENQNIDIQFDSLLNSQEEKANLESNFDNSDKEKIVVTYQSSQESVELEPKFYTLTTVKVNWVASMNSYMHVFIDTTDIHKLEKAKVTNKCMHIMFSSISHELRTPINAFVNANEMIKFGADSIKKFDCIKKFSSKNFENVSKMLDLIDKHTRIATVSSNLLLNLTEDILDFAKIEAGIFTLNSKVFIIIELINEIMFIFEHQWRAKGLEFIIEGDEELLRSEFNSDWGRIKQILINLISNAFKFTRQGYIKIIISSYTERSFEQNQRFLKFVVEDTGVGISEHDQARLFKVFGMVHKHRDEFNLRGTGLGLTITQKLVELLGGEISLESEEENGTKVTFIIKETQDTESEDDYSSAFGQSDEFSSEIIENFSLFQWNQILLEKINPFHTP